MLEGLTAETFAPHVGSAFAVAGGSLVLHAIRDGGPAPSADLRAPFALEFSGQVELEQAIHELDHPALGRLEIFLVRTGPATYEAVFA
jgi:hypothetical protein